MGRGDNKKTLKMRRRKAQVKKKARVAKHILIAKEKAPAEKRLKRSGSTPAPRGSAVTRRASET